MILWNLKASERGIEEKIRIDFEGKFQHNFFRKGIDLENEE